MTSLQTVLFFFNPLLPPPPPPLPSISSLPKKGLTKCQQQKTNAFTKCRDLIEAVLSDFYMRGFGCFLQRDGLYGSLSENHGFLMFDSFSSPC